MTRTRAKKTTRITPTGTKVITTKLVSAPELEWRLQAAAVRRLHKMPGYVAKAPADGVLQPGTFAIAGDFNAARRSIKEATKAKATGITAGEHDIRIYVYGGRLGLIEMKGEVGELSDAQINRHALLRALGFDMQAVVQVSTEDQAADQVEAIVAGWLAASDNSARLAGAFPHQAPAIVYS